MSNSLIPYSFTPGTKAKAQEVNANFIALADKIEENNTTALHQNSSATISGEMTFTQPIYSTVTEDSTGGSLVAKNLTKGKTADLAIAMNESNVRCGSIRVINGDGFNETLLIAANEDGKTSNNIGIRNTNGVAYGFAPTYTTNYADNSNKIVTTAFMANHWVTAKATTTSSASNVRPAVIKQNYVNGTTWYRIWSDGWIEQGGVGAPRATLTLPRKFTNTNYTVNLTNKNNQTNSNYFNVSFNSITTAGFYIYHTGTDTGQIAWYACGY